MPAFRNRTAFELAPGVTVFLNLDAGVTRGEAPNPDAVAKAQARALQRGQRELESKDRRIAELEGLRSNSSGAAASGVSAENIIWVFGTIRTGSTWLGSMMGSLERHSMWNEPRVGELFGHFYYERAAHRRENRNFIMGLDRKLAWLKLIRAFVLGSIAEKYPTLIKGGYLVIKEPSGSLGAPLLAEAMPDSRMILLVRDPRDAVASALDSAKKESWAYELKGSRRRREALGDGAKRRRPEHGDPDAPVRKRAAIYVRDVGNAKQAFDSHAGRKVLVKYEELRADTLGTMKRIYSALDIPIAEDDLARAVEAHAWERIPANEKGEGKFYRKGTPGSWRQDLTPEQAAIVEETTAPLLAELYPNGNSVEDVDSNPNP